MMETGQRNARGTWEDAILGVQTCSPWLAIDQDLVTRFAALTFDEQFIHVDPERAAATAFGGTIAHGFLIVALLTKLQEGAFAPGMPPIAMGINYGFDRLRFVSPLRVGSRIRGKFKVADVADKGGGRFQITTDVEVECEGSEQPVAVARWLTQIFPDHNRMEK